MTIHRTRLVSFFSAYKFSSSCIAQLVIAALVLVVLPLKQTTSLAQNNPLQDAIRHARAAEKVGGGASTIATARRALEAAQADADRNRMREALDKMFGARESIVNILGGASGSESFRRESQSALGDLEKAITAAGGYTLRTRTDRRLLVAHFNTPYGETVVYFPSIAGTGNAISLSMKTEARGATPEVQQSNEKKMRKYTLEVNGTAISATGNPTQINLEANSLDLGVRSQYGSEVARLKIPLPASSNARDAGQDPQAFYMPEIITAGIPSVIVGPFDGNSNNTQIRIGDKDAQVLAESPHMLALLVPRGISGPNNLQLKENDRNASGPIYAASLNLTADNLHLLRGQQTSLHITISGLTGYDKDIPVVLENTTPAVISLPNETISVPANQIGPSGSTTITRPITSVSTGAFNVTATISPTRLTKLSSDDSTRISTPSLAAIGSTQDKQFPGLPKEVNISFISSGNTTGNIGQITVDNKSWRKVDVYLEPAFVPSLGQYQSYIVPQSIDFTVPPGETMTAPISGYCTDVHRPPVPEGQPLPGFIIPLPSAGIPTRGSAPSTGIVPVVPGTTVPVSSAESKPDLILDAALRIIATYDSLRASGQITTPFSGDPPRERETVIQQTIWIYTGQSGNDKYKKEDLQKTLEGQYSTSTGKPITEAPTAVREKIKEGTDDFWNTFTLVGREAKVIRMPETEKTTPVGATTARGRKCLRQPVLPDIDNRIGWDLIGTLNRNRALGRQPSLGFDLNDVRYGYRDKVAAAEASLKSLETTLAGFMSAAEKRELAQASPASQHDKLREILKRKCGNKGVDKNASQNFPKFPREAFFLEIDLCDPGTRDKKNLADFLSPNADTSKVDQWYRDLGKALDNLGLGPAYDGKPLLAALQADIANSLQKIADRYKDFEDGMDVAMRLQYNRTRAWNNFVSGMVTAALAVASAGAAGPLALASLAVSLTGFVFEEGLSAMGADPLAAKLVGALLTLGLGAASGVGGLAVRLGESAKETVRDGAIDAAANALLQKQVQKVVMSMAVLDDDFWNQAMQQLGKDYDARGIASFNAKRDNLKAQIGYVLEDLCRVYNQLALLVPTLQTQLQQAIDVSSSSYWRRMFREELDKAFFNCPCCQWEGEAAVSGKCKFTIPPF